MEAGFACGAHAAVRRMRYALRHRVGRPGSAFACLGMALACVAAAPSMAAAAAPAQPVLVGSVSNSPSVSNSLSATVSVAVSGHYAYTTAYQNGTLTAVDISNPVSPQVTGETAIANSLYGGANVNVFGGYAYVVSKNRNASSTSNDDGTGNSLTIVDIHTNPAVPAIVGSIHDSTNLFGAYGVAISTSGGNTYAYVAAQGLIGGQPTLPDTSTGSFSVVDVTDPTHPFIVPAGPGGPGGHLDNGSLPGSWAASNALDHATSVAVSFPYAYTTAFNSKKLTVINISNPANPTIVSSTQDNVNYPLPNDVVARGNYAYVANQTSSPIHSTLTVVDVSNPARPQVVSSIIGQTSMLGAYRVRLSPNGDFAYVSGEDPSADAVTAVDVSNPAAARVAGFVGDTSSSSPFAHLTGLDVDPTGRYVIASSPYHNTEMNPINPPFGPTTGVISAVQLDPVPVAPTISPASKPPNPTTQRTADFTFSVSDAVAAVQCKLDGAPYSLCTSPTDQQFGSSALLSGTHTFTVQATDAAGSTATDSYTWTVNVPNPAISVATPANGAIFTQNQTVTASYTCTPAANTMLTNCQGLVASGTPIDTSTVGPHAFQVTAIDADGGTATSSTSYTVLAGPRPSLTLSSPAANARYSRNQRVPASYSCKAGAGMSLVSCRGTTANGALISTSTVGPHSFSVTATQQDGQTATVTNSYRVVQPPVLSPVRQQHRIWRVTNTSGQGKPAPPIGTTFRFRLSEAAHVLLAFYLQLPGRRVHGACIASSSRNRSAPRCARLVPASGLQINAHQGMNTIVFSGRLPAHRRLQPGRYELVIKARDAAGLTSDPQKLTFRISGA
jgi:hypothetical protein